MDLIINDLPQHGLLLHGPASPGFRERLNALIEIPADIDEDDLRYTVILDNQSSQPIVQWNLAWRFYPTEDAPFRSRLRGDPCWTTRTGESSAGDPLFSQEWGTVLRPGRQCPYNLVLRNLFLVWGKTKFGVEWVDGVGPEKHAEEIRNQIKTMLAASVMWSVDIDSAFFGDGVFVGPDTGNAFKKIEASLNAGQSLIAELNQKLDDGEDPFRLAERCTSLTEAEINLRFSNNHTQADYIASIYVVERRLKAGYILACRQKWGEQETIAWLREKGKIHIPLIRR